MPLYDFRCNKCSETTEEFCNSAVVEMECACGGIKLRQLSTPRGFVFKAGYYEHIAEEPIYCKSKADLRAACRLNDSYSDYAW
jgi:putative FmdB family regulatory protein